MLKTAEKHSPAQYIVEESDEILSRFVRFCQNRADNYCPKFRDVLKTTV